MPWTCPNCGLHLAPENADPHAFPQPGEIYRCPVCHTELQFDTTARKLRPITPITPSPDEEGARD